MKMDPVVHFEMPCENRELLVKFYTKLFGWQMQKLFIYGYGGQPCKHA
jgi:predicted enzyme related to lactoylglutathione lyase